MAMPAHSTRRTTVKGVRLTWTQVAMALILSCSTATCESGQQILGQAAQFESEDTNSSCADYDIVYAFMNRSRHSGLDSYNIALWTMPDAQIEVALERALPCSRVHVLTDDDGLLTRAQLLASLHPEDKLFVRDVRPLEPLVRDPFLKVYRHQSFNPREFEAYCFWRWGLVAKYFDLLLDQGIPVKRVITLDADVVPAWPFDKWLSAHIDKDFGAKGLHVVVFVRGAATVWSQEFIRGFFPFIRQLYEDPARTREFVEKYGEISRSPCRQGGSEVIPCNASSGRPVVSDMYALKAYMDQHPGKVMRKRRAEDLMSVKDVPGGALFQRFGAELGGDPCVGSMLPHKLPKGWTLTVTGGSGGEDDPQIPRDWYIQVPVIPRPMCFIHFQGRYKHHLEHFCHFALAHQNGSLYTEMGV